MGMQPGDEKLGETGGGEGEGGDEQRVAANRAGEELQQVVHRGGAGRSSEHQRGQTCQDEVLRRLRFEGILCFID